jgi:RimJ/RimL family protein N-acetyltransferase
LEVGSISVPSERGKGYCTEAAEIIVDYLFLSRDVARIQGHAHTKNMTSQKVLENSVLKREGVVRKSMYIGRRMVRHVSLQYSERGMERTENSDETAFVTGGPFPVSVLARRHVR